MELDPICRGSASDEEKIVLGQMKQNAVADDVAAVAARDELFCAVHRELAKAVDRQMRQHLEGVRTLHGLLHHVVRLVEKNAAIAPGALLITPVCVFSRDYRIDIGSDLRISEHIHRIAGGLQKALEALITH